MKNALILKQKKILSIVKDYYLKDNSPYLRKSYFAFYANCIGSRYAKKKLLNSKSVNTKEAVLELMDIFSKSNIKINSNINKNFFFKNLIITWGDESCFSLNGTFNDKYFSINSSTTNSTFWIILCENKINNKKLKKNLAIFYFKKNFFNILKFLKVLILNLFYLFKNHTKVIDQDAMIAESINNYIEKNKSLSKLENLIMPYEGQAFQKIIFNKQKKKNSRLNTYGFDHSAPHSLATQLYYTEGSPDKLIVSGINTKKCYSKFYNWPKNKVHLTFPARYKKFTKNDFLNKMFLPYDFNKTDNIISNIVFLLKTTKNKSIKKFDIRIHPAKKYDKKHLLLKNKIETIQKKYQIKFSKKTDNNIVIVVGFTTTPIVALEFNLTVFHICPDPYLDTYLNFFWPNIRVKKINEFCYKYNLTKYGKYLNFKHKNKLLEIISN
jgi:hypothetical protein